MWPAVVEPVIDRLRRLDRSLRRTAKRSQRAREIYRWLMGRRQRLYLSLSAARSRFPKDEDRGVNPANMVWIFCTSRSGSTWLRSMLAELTGGKVWEEPKVGQLFGNFHNKAQEGQLGSPNFIMGEPTRGGWIHSIRNFTLDGARYAHPFIRLEDYLVIKEPDGAGGAPLLMEALPESRMVLLVRDPRDVAASALDATKKGSWMYETMDRVGWKQKEMSDRNPNRFVRGRAHAYLRQIGNAKRAYDLHTGPKALVRYEDLKSDTLSVMEEVCAALEIPAEKNELVRVVEKHSWENVPEKEKGGGKFYRKGTPGGWREDLTPEQAALVEKITAPLLEELYPPS